MPPDEYFPDAPTLDRVADRIRDLNRRVTDVEDTQKLHNLGVFESRLNTLTDDVKSLKRAFYTFAFSVVGSSVLFAFTVFALLGHKP